MQKKSIKEKQTESRTRHATEIQELTDRKDEVEEELRAYLIGNFRGDRFVYIYDKNEGPPPFPTSFEKKLKVLLHDNLDFPKFREGADMRASGEEGGELLIEDESGGLSPVSGNYEVIDFRHDMQNLAFFFLQNEKFFDLYFKDK